MKERLTHLPTEPFTAEREWAVDGIPVLSASISLPRPVHRDSRTARRIERYYRLQCRAYLRYCENFLLPQVTAEYHAALDASRPLPAVHARLEHRITWQQDGLWSLYTQSSERGLSSTPRLLVRRGDTWDLAAGYPVPLQAFFPDNRCWKKDLLAAAEAEILRQEAAGIVRCHDNWRRALRRQFNPQNHYLTEDGLTFFYPMYAIAPPSAGIPTFTIPYGQLRLPPERT